MRALIETGGPRQVTRLGLNGDAIAISFQSPALTERNREFIDAGCKWDWPEFKAHVTLTWRPVAEFNVSKLPPFDLDLVFGREKIAEVNKSWGDKTKPKSLIPGSVYARRDILNKSEITKWCEDAGLDGIQSDMHVTIMFSKTPPERAIPLTDVGSIVNRSGKWEK